MDNDPSQDESTPIEWGKLLWFHVPVFLVGGVIVLPLLFYLMAEAGALVAGSERITQKVTERLLLGVLSIAPVAYAFGRDLRFSTGRFIVAVVVLGFMQLTIAMRSTMLGGTVLPVTLGGGIVGIGLGYALGHVGLRLRLVFQGAKARRLALAAVATVVLCIAVLELRDYYRHLQYKEAEAARRAVEKAQHTADWEKLLDSLEASGSSLNVDTKRNSPLDQTTLTWRLNDQVVLSLSLTNCVRIRFENRDKRLPFIDRFLASRTAIEARLGNTLTFGKPKMRRVQAGPGVSQRDVARIPGYWNNGSIASCLGDRADGQDRNAWIVDQVEMFFDILKDPLYAIRDPSPMIKPRSQRPSQAPISPDPRKEKRDDVTKRLGVVRYSCLRLNEDITELERSISAREQSVSDDATTARDIQRKVDADLLASDRSTLAELRQHRIKCEQQIADLNKELESLNRP